jgi:Zn-dependent peptidase ImmA (M78 family)
MPVKEARGFSLSDGPIPTVVLNSSDVLPARIFTLFHELAHLALNTPGVCIPELDGASDKQRNGVEQYCNHFSGALLVPVDALGKDLPRHGDDDSGIEEAARRAAARLKVSRYVILYRFMLAEAVGKTQFYRIMNRWQQASVEAPRKTPGGPPPAVRTLSRLGSDYVSLVLDAHSRGFITTSDVADYLSLKTRHLARLQRLITVERRA